MKKLEAKLLKLAEIENLSVDNEAVHSTGEKIKDIYCKHLPYSIIGLELSYAAVPNPIAKLIIRLAIMIQKGVGSKICDQKDPDEKK